MWFNDRPDMPDWSQGLRHLAKCDPAMKRLIRAVGPCTLAPRRDYYVVLLQSIFTQQISTAVATVLFNRCRDLFPRRRPTPELLLKLTDDQLRSVGLSRQKQAYVRDLSERFARGEIPTRRFAKMTDEQIIQALLPIKGVGRWTAEMFLIFVLNRPDIWPVDDLGVRKMTQEVYGMEETPVARDLVSFADQWRPWRTLATWYLWRYGNLPLDQRQQPIRGRGTTAKISG